MCAYMCDQCFIHSKVFDLGIHVECPLSFSCYTPLVVFLLTEYESLDELSSLSSLSCFFSSSGPIVTVGYRGRTKVNFV